MKNNATTTNIKRSFSLSMLTLCATILLLTESMFAGIVLTTKGLVSIVFLMLMGALFVVVFAFLLLVVFYKPSSLYYTLDFSIVINPITAIKRFTARLKTFNQMYNTIAYHQNTRFKAESVEAELLKAERVRVLSEVRALRSNLVVAQLGLAKRILEEYETLSPDQRDQFLTNLELLVNKP